MIIRNLNLRGCKDSLAQLSADHKLIEQAIGAAQTRAEVANVEVVALGRALSAIIAQTDEVRARKADLEAAEEAARLAEAADQSDQSPKDSQ